LRQASAATARQTQIVTAQPTRQGGASLRKRIKILNVSAMGGKKYRIALEFSPLKIFVESCSLFEAVLIQISQLPQLLSRIIFPK
jgi:hypothetical protein